MASIIIIEIKENTPKNQLNIFFSNINEYMTSQKFDILDASNTIIYFNKLNVPPNKLNSYTTFIKNTTGYHSTIKKIFIGSNIHAI